MSNHADEPSVTLINPPSPFLYIDREQIPLGLLYVSAILKRDGIDVEVLDLAGEEQWQRIVDGHNFKNVVGITATSPHHPISKTIVKIISLRRPDAFFIAGGPHPNIVPERYMEIGFDAVVTGEAENAVSDVVIRRRRGVTASGIVENLDNLPMPAWELIDLPSYRQTFFGKKIIHLITSRGCPYSCAFCSQSVFHRKTRFRKPENVLKEIHILHHEYGYERMMFMDDTFGVNRDYAFAILDGLKPLGILWRCHFRANLCNRETFEKMVDCGCRHITLGIESGSQKILDTINKETTVEMNTKAMQLAREAGLKVKAFTIVGLPGETIETMESTKRWLLDNAPDDFDLQIFHPYEDCDIFQHPEKYDISFPRNLPYENSWFKGNPVGYVGTSSLTPERITAWRNEAFGELTRILKPARPF